MEFHFAHKLIVSSIEGTDAMHPAQHGGLLTLTLELTSL